MVLIKFDKLKFAFYILPLVAASISSCTSAKETIYPFTPNNLVTLSASQVSQTVEIYKAENDNRIVTLRLRNDKSLQPELDSIVEEISRSFRGYERTL
ncbi:MAG: hypothetical protein KI793_09830 [Rivularia sp. (in: Bacteria)]|nr:hypothetical protein [Rivularia sp. MS3]